MQVGCAYALVRHMDRVGNDGAAALGVGTLRVEIENAAIREKRN